VLSKVRCGLVVDAAHVHSEDLRLVAQQLGGIGAIIPALATSSLEEARLPDDYVFVQGEALLVGFAADENIEGIAETKF